MLGVPMGLDIDESNMEDREFRRMLIENDLQTAAEHYFRRLRNGRELVGVKSPVVIDRLREFFGAIAEPVLIVVSRDVYATAQREQCSGNEFFASLREAIRRKFAVLDFVEAASAPLLVVSYERLMQDPDLAIESISRFITGSVDPELVRRTRRLVRPHADMPHDADFVVTRREFERQQSPHIA